MAMGNALVADRAGGGDPYHNPALAAYGDRSVSATFGVLAADRELQTIGFRTPLPPTAGISIGLIHGGVNEIDGRDPSGYHTRTYSSDEYAAQADFGFRLAERLALGLGLRLYRTSLTERLEAANTLGLRAGVLARVTSDLTLGLAAGDLLSGYRWDSSSLYEGQGARVNDQFPVRLRAGGAYRLWADRLRLHAEYEGRFVRGERIVETVELVGGSPRTVRRVEPVSSLRGVFRVGAEWIATGSFRVRGGLSGLRASAPRPIEPSAGFAIREHVRGVPLRLSYAAVLEPYVTQPVHVVSLRVELSDASE